MDYVFEVSGKHTERPQLLPTLQEQVERLGGSLAWIADEYAGYGRRVRSSRFVIEIRFPHEAISGAATFVSEVATTRGRRKARIDSIFREPSCMLYRSPALGHPECVLSSSPPRNGRQRHPPGVYSDEDGALIAAIAQHLG